jgi:hypothetical protein
MREQVKLVLMSAVSAAIMLAATTTLGSAAAFAQPADDASSCSSGCDVGALGQGGVSSDGRARGSYHKGPGRVPGVNSRAAGTEDSGRLELSGALEGTLSGTFHGPTFRGRTTGIFGDCTGGSCTP